MDHANSKQWSWILGQVCLGQSSILNHQATLFPYT